MPLICSIKGCGKPARATGMCMHHYDNNRRNGAPENALRIRRANTTDEERLAFYTKRGRGCWEWTGGKISTGYGLAWTNGGSRVLAHRLSYTLNCGPIPYGMQVLHKCDNPACVKPAHLFLGTQADNVADMEQKGRDHKVGRHGEDNNGAKIDAATVRAIRASSLVAREAATHFGVSKSLVHAIRQRRLWAHITDA